MALSLSLSLSLSKAAHTTFCFRLRAVAEPDMQLHYLPLLEARRHLSERGCAVLATEACDDFVAIPGRDSTSHCLIFAKLADRNDLQ